MRLGIRLAAASMLSGKPPKLAIRKYQNAIVQ